MKYTVLLALLFTLSSAYIEDYKYYFYADLRPQHAYVLAEGEQNNNRGVALFEYDGSKEKLTYHIGFTNSFFETVTLNGPSGCAFFRQSDASCVSNIGFEIARLAKGVSIPPEGTEPKQNILEGSISVSSNLREMLFDGELYILVTRMSQPLPGEKVGKLNRVLLGRLYSYNIDQANRFRSFLIFGSNDGSYDPSFPKKTSDSSAIGFLDWSSATTLSYDIFHNIGGNPRLILKCPTRSVTISNTAASPVSGNLDLSDATLTPVLMSVFADEGCFLFFTSAALPEGDLFARPSHYSPFISSLTGSNMVPAVSSANYGRSFVFLNRGPKTLSFITRTNITSGTITSATVHLGSKSEAGTDAVCVLYTKPTNNPGDITSFTSCTVNQTVLDSLEEEGVFVKISTDANPGGELRGTIVPTYKFESKPKVATSGGLSEGAKIGLGVGLGIGGALLLVGIIATVALVSRK